MRKREAIEPRNRSGRKPGGLTPPRPQSGFFMMQHDRLRPLDCAELAAHAAERLIGGRERVAVLARFIRVNAQRDHLVPVQGDFRA